MRMYGLPSNEPAENGAALLAAVLVAVAPAVAGEAFADRVAIVAAQRRQRGEDDFDRLVPRVVHADVGDDRHVGVVEVQIRQPHLPPPHVVVFVQRGKLAVDRGDQVVVDRDRHLVGKQRRLQRRGVIAGLGVVDVPLHRGVQRLGQRVLVRGVLPIIGRKRLLANLAGPDSRATPCTSRDSARPARLCHS